MKHALKQMRLILPFLPEGARRYISIYITISCLLSLLDVGALMLLGLSLSSMMVGADVNIPIIGAISQDSYVWLLLAVSLLILLKSVLALLQQWHATRRFADFELVLGVRLFDAYIGAPWVERLGRTSSQLVRMADVDANNRVPSTRVADADISYTGKGDVARASRQGWLSRFFQVVSPF